VFQQWAETESVGKNKMHGVCEMRERKESAREMVGIEAGNGTLSSRNERVHNFCSNKNRNGC